MFVFKVASVGFLVYTVNTISACIYLTYVRKYLLGLWCLLPGDSVDGSFKDEFFTVAEANLSEASQGPGQFSFIMNHSLSPGWLC